MENDSERVLSNVIKIDDERIKGHLDRIVRGTVEETLNALLDAEAGRLVGAGRYERSEERRDYRSGHYERQLHTKAGEVTLKVPKLRAQTLDTAIIERYRRRESSVEEALMEMYLAGVSVRRVEDITEALWGTRVSPSAVSDLNKKIYERIEAWRNQPIAGTRPYAALSASSHVMPGTPLGNITEVESSGASKYNGLWVSLNRRFSGQLQLAGSYTFSKSMDYNSLSSQGVGAQNSYDIRAEWAPSDYDTRHRFVASLIYLLPFKGNSLIEGWEVAAVVQGQSGNPINIVVNNSALTGFPNTVRPDVSGPIQVFGDVNRWFDTSVFTAVPSFGNLPRNAVVGPRFDNTDVSLAKNIALADKVRLQLRIDAFDIFNHPNFG